MWVDFTTVRLADIIMPELFECTKICVAKKRIADAIYYSGITVDQLGRRRRGRRGQGEGEREQARKGKAAHVC